MKFGLNEKQYEFILKNVVEPLEAQGAIVWCYGSRARGDHHKFSDLDLMVENSLDQFSVIAEIQENLINSNFPFKVDIVRYNDFAESYKPNYQKDKVRFSSLF
jgi:predicted nucleotidyltransferase